MKITLEELQLPDGFMKAKLACVKRIKELTGLGLRDAKILVDSTRYGPVVIDVSHNASMIENMKHEFTTWVFKIYGGRSEALDDLLGDVYKYVFEYLNRDVTYKIEEGSYVKSETGNLYILDVEIGTKENSNGSNSINGKKITIPVESVIIEENV